MLKEFWIKFWEISKESFDLLYSELQKLYKLMKKKIEFTQRKQRAIKDLTSPILEKRSKELQTLDRAYTKLLEEESLMRNDLIKTNKKISLLDQEIDLLLKENYNHEETPI